MIECDNCGKIIRTGENYIGSDYQDKELSFCSESCLEEYFRISDYVATDGI